MVSSIGFALAFWFGGGWVIRAFIADPAARDAALTYLPWCAAVPLVGVLAWQLDGVFLGTTQGPAIRNAAILAMTAYLLSDMILAPRFGNHGVWAAFLMQYAYRAGGLMLFWPGLMKRVAAVTAPPGSAQ